VAAIRADEIHKATTALATGHEVVAVEQLSAKNMARRGGRRKHGLNRALGDAAVGGFVLTSTTRAPGMTPRW
jgi:putative transposase